jgi:hypothetical protein
VAAVPIASQSRIKKKGPRMPYILASIGCNFVMRMGVLLWNSGRKHEREIYFMNIGCGRV